MREIKFRAWKESENKMLSWNELLDSTFKSGALILNDVLTGVYLKAVMQYTGLKDKNGKEIYEGDIYTQGDKNIRYQVIFNDCQFIGKQVSNSSLAGLTYFADKIEIIGNIYENKNLLDSN